MKIVILIARLLLGLTFVVLGLNGFLNFLSMGPMPTGLAGQFISALILSHYFWVVAALQLAGGALLLVNRYVPLALVLQRLFSPHGQSLSTLAAALGIGGMMVVGAVQSLLVLGAITYQQTVPFFPAGGQSASGSRCLGP